MKHLICILFALMFGLDMSAQSSYMSYSESKDEACIANLDGWGGVLILSRMNNLVVTVNNARAPRITPKGKRADGMYVYEVAVDRKDTKEPKVEINKRGDVDKIDFVVTTKADFFRAYIIEEVAKPIRMEDQTKSNDVITDERLSEVEITSPIADLQIQCPKELNATVTSSKKAGDKTITITSIKFPVQPLLDLKAEIARLEGELAKSDAEISRQLEKQTLSEKQVEELVLRRDQQNEALQDAQDRWSTINHIDLFAEGTNRLAIDLSEAGPRRKFCWGVLLRTVVVKEHVTDFNAKFSEGARLFSLREYDNARRNFLAAKEAKDAPGELIPSVVKNIADCDTCILYETYSKGALLKMKQMKQQGSGSQAEVVKYASAALEFISVLNKYNPCDFYSSRIETLDKLIEEMPLDLKVTIVNWVQGFSGFSEGKGLANVELWADYGTGNPPYKEYQTDKKFKSYISKNSSRFKQMGVTDPNGEIVLHLSRKNLPHGIFFHPVGYKGMCRILYMDFQEILQKSKGEYNMRQFRMRMNITQ